MVVGNLDYNSNINPQYNTLAIYESIQSAIKSFIDRFISVSPLSSPSFKAPHHLFFSLRPQIRAEQERQGHLGLLLLRRLSRLGVQSAVRSQRFARFSSLSSLDINGKRLNTSVFAQLADPDPLYLCPIYFYVKSFILQSTLLANRSLSRLC